MNFDEASSHSTADAPDASDCNQRRVTLPFRDWWRVFHFLPFLCHTAKQNFFALRYRKPRRVCAHTFFILLK
jgi:hypothetical protein